MEKRSKQHVQNSPDIPVLILHVALGIGMAHFVLRLEESVPCVGAFYLSSLVPGGWYVGGTVIRSHDRLVLVL